MYGGVRKVESAATAPSDSADPADSSVLCALDFLISCVLLVAGSKPAAFHAAVQFQIFPQAGPVPGDDLQLLFLSL